MYKTADQMIIDDLKRIFYEKKNIDFVFKSLTEKREKNRKESAKNI